MPKKSAKKEVPKKEVTKKKVPKNEEELKKSHACLIVLEKPLKTASQNDIVSIIVEKKKAMEHEETTIVLLHILGHLIMIRIVM